MTWSRAFLCLAVAGLLAALGFTVWLVGAMLWWAGEEAFQRPTAQSLGWWTVCIGAVAFFLGLCVGSWWGAKDYRRSMLSAARDLGDAMRREP